MKSLRVLKTDIEEAWLEKLESLPIKYFTEWRYAYYVIVDDDFDDEMLGVKCINFLSQEKLKACKEE